MSFAKPAPLASTTPASVTSAAEAERLAAHFVEVLDLLVEIIKEETALVRAGRLTAAAKLEPAKSELARLYTADARRLRTSYKFLAAAPPEVFAGIRRR